MNTEPALVLTLSNELVELVKASVDARADEIVRGFEQSPWLDAEGAAEYLCCPVSRIRKLTSSRDLPVHRDGSRVLYRRDELDAFVAAGGAICP